MAFGRNGLLASGSMDRTVRLWDVSDPPVPPPTRRAAHHQLRGLVGHIRPKRVACQPWLRRHGGTMGRQRAPKPPKQPHPSCLPTSPPQPD
ncbi:hypothetical protein [Pseudofrankia sp. EUN1h]|uniref:hypothetical protein n=1 Tax=Pseudofrankia sp. EUN1h TaxID=1834515 RepID=UPI001E652B61|nr:MULTISPECIES: hypothetical protein [Pseudofrankia]